VWVQATSNKERQREAAKKIERNAAKAQQKGAGKGGKNKGMMMDDDATDASAKPRKWNDYSVKFEFPEPLETNDMHLLQLIDAHFTYPGRDDFGMHDMNVGIGMGSRVRPPHALPTSPRLPCQNWLVLHRFGASVCESCDGNQCRASRSLFWV
jgi:hypothetical protein